MFRLLVLCSGDSLMICCCDHMGGMSKLNQADSMQYKQPTSGGIILPALLLMFLVPSYGIIFQSKQRTFMKRDYRHSLGHGGYGKRGGKGVE